MSARSRGRQGRFEIRDVLPGWSAADGSFLEPSEDVLENIANADFDCSIELTIGVRSQTPTARFTVTVATPQALLSRAESGAAVVSDRATIIVSKADWPAIRSHLDSVVAGCMAPTLDEALDYFNQYFRYEYDDFAW